MAKYLLRYQWFPGDEDPDSDKEFESENDEAAVQYASSYGRPGDLYTLYRLVQTVHIQRKDDRR